MNNEQDLNIKVQVDGSNADSQFSNVHSKLDKVKSDLDEINKQSKLTEQGFDNFVKQASKAASNLSSSIAKEQQKIKSVLSQPANINTTQYLTKATTPNFSNIGGTLAFLEQDKLKRSFNSIDANAKQQQNIDSLTSKFSSSNLSSSKFYGFDNIRNVSSSFSDLDKRIGSLNGTITSSIDRTTKLKNAFGSVSGEVKSFSSSASRNFSYLNSNITSGGENLGKFKRNVSGAIFDLGKGFNSASEATRQFGNVVDVAIGSIVGISVTRALASMSNLISEITMAPVKISAQFESIQTDFKVFLGSMEQSKDFVSKITKLASVTPLESQDLLKSAQMMISFGISTDKIIPKLKQLGDITGGDAQKFQQMTLGFSQASAMGKILGNDLLQMTSAGLSVKHLAAAMGMTVDKFYELKEDGLISIRMVEEAFRKLTSEGGIYYNRMAEKSQTTLGLWSTLRDNFALIANAFGQLLLPSIKNTEKNFISMAENLTKNITNFAELELITGNLGKSLSNLANILGIGLTGVGISFAFQTASSTVEYFRYQLVLASKESVVFANILNGNFSLAMSQIVDKFKLLTLAFLTNPFVQITLAVTACAAAFYMFRTEQETGKDVIAKVTAKYTKQRQELDDLVTAIDNLREKTKRTKEEEKLYLELKDELIEKYPQYKSILESETSIKEAQLKINKNLQISELQLAKSKMESETQVFELRLKNIRKLISENNKLKDSNVVQVAAMGRFGLQPQKETSALNLKNNLNDTKKELDDNLSSIKDIQNKIVALQKEPVTAKDTEQATGTGKGKGKNKSEYDIDKNVYSLQSLRKELKQKNIEIENSQKEELQKLKTHELAKSIVIKSFEEGSFGFEERLKLTEEHLNNIRDLTLKSEEVKNEAVTKLEEKLQQDKFNIAHKNYKNKSSALLALEKTFSTEKNQIDLDSQKFLNTQLMHENINFKQRVLKSEEQLQVQKTKISLEQKTLELKQTLDMTKRVSEIELNVKKQNISFQKQMGFISDREELARNRKLLQEEYDAKRDFLRTQIDSENSKLQQPGRIVSEEEKQQIKNSITDLNNELQIVSLEQNSRLLEIDNESMLKRTEVFRNFFTDVKNSHTNFIQDVLNGNDTIQNSFKNLISSVESAWSNMIAELIIQAIKIKIVQPIFNLLTKNMTDTSKSAANIAVSFLTMASSAPVAAAGTATLVATQQVAGPLMEKFSPIAENLSKSYKQMAVDAGGAANEVAKLAVSHAADSVAWIPIIGATMAPVAALTTGASIAAGSKIAQFAKGGIVPGNYNQPVPIIAHGEEAVFNKKQQSELYDIANGKGKGKGKDTNPTIINVNHYITAFDSRDVKEYLIENAQLVNNIVVSGIERNQSMRNAIRGVS